VDGAVTLGFAVTQLSILGFKLGFQCVVVELLAGE
jgi:hypothetical protein